MEQQRRTVDVRHVAVTTLVVVTVTLVSVGSVLAVGRLWKVVTYLMVALFFAVILTPPVDYLQYRLKMRRGLATFLVLLVGLAALSGLIYAFVKPLVDQGTKFSDSVPTMVEDAQKGKGTVGHLVKKYELQNWVDKNRATIDKQARAAGGKGLGVVRSVFSGIVEVSPC